MSRLTEKLKEDTGLIDRLLAVAEKKGYKVYHSNPSYPKNLNIWGIRSNDKETKTFNDALVVFYDSPEGKWVVDVYEGTTDPSEDLLKSPINSKGTAVLVEGQYKGVWQLGLHNGKYEAWKQTSPVKVYRDANKDGIVDKDGKIDEGYFGINLHRASAYNIYENIGPYSAGCQVFKSYRDFNNVLAFAKSTMRKSSDSFTYTLIEENDLGYE